MTPRPLALLAEVTYRCPLHCPYCSNPAQALPGSELSTDEWRRVCGEAAALGGLHAGFSGGEPLARPDLAEIIAGARAAGLYTNLLTSGLGLTAARVESLRAAGLDSLQLSFQADEAVIADSIAGVPAHTRKLEAARLVREAGLPLSLNVVLHRTNIGRLAEIIALAESLQATRIELANTQYYGWAHENRAHLLPMREQVEEARAVADAARSRIATSSVTPRLEIFYVLPDYYETRPKPCLQGWGQRYLTVNPTGHVLPCPTATHLPGMHFENVRERPLAWIWRESESFNRFRGTVWMPEPCRSCPQREIDFGGCRCQAALLTGDPAATDPVCTLSPQRGVVDAILQESAPDGTWRYRQNPA